MPAPSRVLGFFQVSSYASVVSVEAQEEYSRIVAVMGRELRAAQYHGTYFDRGAKAGRRLCTPEGWFCCQVRRGSWGRPSGGCTSAPVASLRASQPVLSSRSGIGTPSLPDGRCNTPHFPARCWSSSPPTASPALLLLWALLREPPMGRGVEASPWLLLGEGGWVHRDSPQLLKLLSRGRLRF